MNSDTPRTDEIQIGLKLGGDILTILLHHARQLERELSAAQAQVLKADEAVDALDSQREKLEQQLAAAIAERDAIKKAKQENDERFMLERDEARRDRDANKAGWDSASLTALRLERERDEARRKRDELIVKIAHAQHDEFCATRDGDQARECLREAIAFVEVGNPTLVSLQRWRAAAGLVDG